MTPTIDLLLSHRSIRHFTDEPITEAQRTAIINSARATSSSSFLQCSSIIRITDPAMREQLVTLAGGQKHVAQAAEFWVFCADFNRHLQICPEAELGLAEQLLLGVVDTALMAQNAFTAAESLGLGGVYIGGGIVPRLLPELERSSFRERFEAKGRFRGYLAAMPTWVIRAGVSPALAGAARALDTN